MECLEDLRGKEYGVQEGLRGGVWLGLRCKQFIEGHRGTQAPPLVTISHRVDWSLPCSDHCHYLECSHKGSESKLASSPMILQKFDQYAFTGSLQCTDHYTRHFDITKGNSLCPWDRCGIIENSPGFKSKFHRNSAGWAKLTSFVPVTVPGPNR